MQRKLSFLLLVFIFSNCSQSFGDSYNAGSMDPYLGSIEALLEENDIPGAALTIVTKDEVIRTYTWGLRDVELQDVVNDDTVFRIASMSKTFAGTAIGMLVEESLLDLDRTVESFFPGMRLGNGYSHNKITVRHVASQSTGLMPHAYSNLLDDGLRFENIKMRVHQIPAVCKPGVCYGYQNVVFSLLQDVVEMTSTMPYPNFLQANIFEPLGMRDSSVGLESFLDGDNVSRPHRLVRGKWRTTSTNSAYYSVAAAAGVNATINDMGVWVRAHLGAFPQVLSRAMLAEIHGPVVESPTRNYFNRWEGMESAYYGTGWRVFDMFGTRVVHHGGGVRGYRSEMALVPEEDIGMVLMINAESNIINEVVPLFVKHILSVKGAQEQKL
ncbi:beta-lactamase family protein [Gammaproteobacteria bacterium]|nr:beta-lactamase family protein [Gammaproteobacteria bacterium]